MSTAIKLGPLDHGRPMTYEEYLEGDFHPARCINMYKAHRTPEVLLVCVDRDVPVCIIHGYTEAGAGYNVFRIFCDKWRRVIACTVWNFNNLSRVKSF